MVLLCAVAVATIVRCLRVGMRAMRAARIMRLAALAGEAVPGIRTLDIPGSAIMARVTVIRMAGVFVYHSGGGSSRVFGYSPSGLFPSPTGVETFLGFPL